MSDAAVTFLLQNLKELLFYSAEKLRKAKNIYSEARNETTDLGNSLEPLLGFIKDSATNPVNYEMQALIRSVQSVVDDANDAIDNFMVELARHTSRSRVERYAKMRVHFRTFREIAQDIKKINQEVDTIYRRKLIGTEQNSSMRREDSVWKCLVQGSVAEKDDVVGFDGPAQELIASLIGGSEKLDVISIVGMVGLGKTTLVKKVYDDARIASEFVYRVWVTVSKDPNTKDPIENIFISILKDLEELENENTKKDLKTTTKLMYDKLRKKVKEFLQEKKYLIVLDDIWTLDDWSKLKTAFPDNTKHSRILLTTQVKAIAENAHRNPYELKFLKDDDIWRLLEKMNLLGDYCSNDLRGYGEQIAKNCKGLPHVMVEIGNTLRRNHKNMESKWKNVVPRVNELILENGSRFEKVVALRVNSLHPNLKVCFLYFGLIPRGPIPAWKLIRLWIAEGFIKDESTLGLENTASKWLQELVDLNLVIATSWEFNGETKKCYVHDSLHAFCKKEAEAQNLYRVIHRSNIFSLKTSSRVCVNSEVVQDLPSKPDGERGERVRTLLTYPEKINLKPDELETMLGAFKRIRILDISFITASQFPKVLKENHLLKFLAFSCDFEFVPSSISRLWSLETLIILRSNTAGMITFDEKFWKLYKLKHLQTDASFVLPLPPPNKKLDKLQTLSTIAPESCMKELFLMTPNIVKLGVKGKLSVLLDNGSTLVENLKELKYLKYLKLINDSSTISNLSQKLPLLLKNLRKLTISGTSLKWEHIMVLGDLEKLEALKLKNNAFEGQIWSVIDGSFQKLTFLNIDTTDLATWVADGKQFRSLSHLVLKNCNHLAALPNCLGSLRGFKTLDICRCSRKVEQSARDFKNTHENLLLSIKSIIV